MAFPFAATLPTLSSLDFLLQDDFPATSSSSEVEQPLLPHLDDPTIIRVGPVVRAAVHPPVPVVLPTVPAAQPTGAPDQPANHAPASYASRIRIHVSVSEGYGYIIFQKYPIHGYVSVFFFQKTNNILKTVII